MKKKRKRIRGIDKIKENNNINPIVFYEHKNIFGHNRKRGLFPVTTNSSNSDKYI